MRSWDMMVTRKQKDCVNGGVTQGDVGRWGSSCNPQSSPLSLEH